MASRIGIATLLCAALAPTTRAGAQPGSQLLRVEGAIETYHIDGDVGFTGEYHVLRPGKHTLTFSGVQRGRLTVTLNAGSFGVRLAGTAVSDVCADGARAGDDTTEVRAWPVQLRADRQANGASVLVVRDAALERRTRALSPCANVRWDSTATWKLNVTSTPAGASVAAGEKYLASTDARLSLPYGVSAPGGNDEEIHVRVYKPGFIGCTFLLSDLRKTKSNDVNCDLMSPIPAATGPGRP